MRYFIILLSVWSLIFIVNGMPQDLQTGIIMAVGQAKDIMDNGAAGRYGKSVEVFGAKFKNDMEIGFGDAVKHKRSAEDEEEKGSSSSSSSSLSSSSSDSVEVVTSRRKRAVTFNHIAEKIRNLI